MISATFYFLLALIILITFHEFGHFIVARWCKVKVLRFSLGFGKVLYGFKDKKGTEYALSLIPLGGYVKMLDEGEGYVKPEERHLAFNRKPVWQRIAIVSAGPLFNFLFAFIALFLMFTIGIKSIAPIIAEVKPGSVFSEASVKNNSEILSFADKPIHSWRDFQFAIMPYIGKSNGVVRVNLKDLQNNKPYSVNLPLQNFVINSSRPDLLNSLGIVPYIPDIKPEIAKVNPESVAEKAGLKPQDVITKINGVVINNWFTLAKYIKEHPDTWLVIDFERNAKPQSLRVKTDSTKFKGKNIGVLGISSGKLSIPENYIRTDRQNPITAARIAFIQTFELTKSTFVLIGRLVTGKISVKSLSGPLGIAEGADTSAKGGISYYLLFLAIVSISLGVLNLLPIPILDGGHLLYYLFEIILGRPLSLRMQAFGSYLGLILLVIVMTIAISNDLFRLLE